MRANARMYVFVLKYVRVQYIEVLDTLKIKWLICNVCAASNPMMKLCLNRAVE